MKRHLSPRCVRWIRALLFAGLLLATRPAVPPAAAEEAAPAPAAEAPKETFRPEEFTDIDAQYRPSKSGKSFVWFLENAGCTDLLETLQSIFKAEIDDRAMSITPNYATNSLMVTFKKDGTDAAHRQILDLLKHMDRQLGQILIEVLVAEVQIDDLSDLGFEWRYDGHGVANRTGLESRAEIDHGLLREGVDIDQKRLAMNGGKFAIAKADRVRGFLNGLISNEKINLISSPKIIAANNRTSTLTIKSTVPIVSGVSVNENGTRVDTYKDFEALIELTVTPRLGRGQIISMDVTQKLDELGPYDEVNKLVEKVQREVSTTLVLSDNQTAVLGGFLKTERGKKSERVPGLSRIPGLGQLFGTRNRADKKTELMIFITPKVLDTVQDGDFATRNITANLAVKKALDPHLAERQVAEAPHPANEVVLVQRSAPGWTAHRGGRELRRLLDEPARRPDVAALFRDPMNRLDACVAPFGYGDLKITSAVYRTILKPDTAYGFVHAFEIDDPARYDSLTVRDAADNAAAVYVNGVMVDHDPYLATESGHDFEYWNRVVPNVPASLLRPGRNEVFAILKNEANSNEAWFDLELVGILKAGPAGAPLAELASPPGSVSPSASADSRRLEAVKDRWLPK